WAPEEPSMAERAWNALKSSFASAAAAHRQTARDAAGMTPEEQFWGTAHALPVLGRAAHTGVDLYRGDPWMGDAAMAGVEGLGLAAPAIVKAGMSLARPSWGVPVRGALGQAAGSIGMRSTAPEEMDQAIADYLAKDPAGWSGRSQQWSQANDAAARKMQRQNNAQVKKTGQGNKMTLSQARQKGAQSNPPPQIPKPPTEILDRYAPREYGYRQNYWAPQLAKDLSGVINNTSSLPGLALLGGAGALAHETGRDSPKYPHHDQPLEFDN